MFEILTSLGDKGLAGKISEYILKIPNGEQEMLRQEMLRQYDRHVQRFEKKQKEKPYDLMPLIKSILAATPEEAETLLNDMSRDIADMSGDNALCQAMKQFHNDWAPKVLDTPRTLYILQSIRDGHQVFYREWYKLYRTSGDNYNMIDLVWRAMSFMMRRSHGMGQCMMAQGLHSLIKEAESFNRSNKFDYGDGLFPETTSDDSRTGIGFQCWVDIYFGALFMSGPHEGECCRVNSVQRFASLSTHIEQLLQFGKTHAPATCPSAGSVCTTLSR